MDLHTEFEFQEDKGTTEAVIAAEVISKRANSSLG